MLSKQDIKFQARKAVLWCWRTGQTFGEWADTKDLWDNDWKAILNLFNNRKFRKTVLMEPKNSIIDHLNKKGFFNIVKNIPSKNTEKDS